MYRLRSHEAPIAYILRRDASNLSLIYYRRESEIGERRQLRLRLFGDP